MSFYAKFQKEEKARKEREAAEAARYAAYLLTDEAKESAFERSCEQAAVNYESDWSHEAYEEMVRDDMMGRT